MYLIQFAAVVPPEAFTYFFILKGFRVIYTKKMKKKLGYSNVKDNPEEPKSSL